jgi:hypothetical protein
VEGLGLDMGCERRDDNCGEAVVWDEAVPLCEVIRVLVVLFEDLDDARPMGV